MKTNLHFLLTMLLLVGTLSFSQAQINLNKVKDKIGGKKKEEPKKEEPKNTSAEGNSQQTNNQNKPSKKGELQALLAKLKQENKVQVLSKTGTNPASTTAEFPAYLTFTNDFNTPDKEVSEFTGKDFIYTRFKLPKNILEYLPKPDDSNLEYYRAKITAKANGAEEENSHRVEMKNYVKDAFNTNDLVIAVVPEKLFFENFTLAYQKDGKFPSASKEREAY